MKLSEFKEYIIRNCGKELWEQIESSYDYKVYRANKEEQLELIKRNPFAIRYINNPTEEMQLEAIKDDNYVIKYIDNLREEVIEYAVKTNNCIVTFKNLLRHIEKDLEEK